MSPVEVPANTAITKILDTSNFGILHLAMDPHEKNSKFLLRQTFFNASPNLRFVAAVEPLTPPGHARISLEQIELARIAQFDMPLPANEVHGFTVNGSTEKTVNVEGIAQIRNFLPKIEKNLSGNIRCVGLTYVPARPSPDPIAVAPVEYGQNIGHITAGLGMTHQRLVAPFMRAHGDALSPKGCRNSDFRSRSTRAKSELLERERERERESRRRREKRDARRSAGG